MPRRSPTPKGKNLFGEGAPEQKPATVAAYRINIDGGSRGNPGPAAYGVLIRDANGAPGATLKKYIRRFHNNGAEFRALSAAREYAHSHSARASRSERD